MSKLQTYFNFKKFKNELFDVHSGVAAWLQISAHAFPSAEDSCGCFFSQGFTGKPGLEGPQGPVGMYVSATLYRC